MHSALQVVDDDSSITVYIVHRTLYRVVH